MRKPVSFILLLCLLPQLACANEGEGDTVATDAVQTDGSVSADAAVETALLPLDAGPEAGSRDAAKPDAPRGSTDASEPEAATDSTIDDAGLPEATNDGGRADASLADAAPRDVASLPYTRAVAGFVEGANAGFGGADYPEVVLGPPMGQGLNAGSLDVLSLGVGGSIVLDFGPGTIVDGPGPDFIVFENAFWPGGQSASVFAELGEVSVSSDNQTWFTFACLVQGDGSGRYPGCAGWTPTLMFDPFDVVPLDPARTGGDAFDLATLSLPTARYVRVRDLSLSGQGSTAGFDLDAVGVIHASSPLRSRAHDPSK